MAPGKFSIQRTTAPDGTSRVEVTDPNGVRYNMDLADLDNPNGQFKSLVEANGIQDTDAATLKARVQDALSDVSGADRIRAALGDIDYSNPVEIELETRSFDPIDGTSSLDPPPGAKTEVDASGAPTTKIEGQSKLDNEYNNLDADSKQKLNDEVDPNTNADANKVFDQAKKDNPDKLPDKPENMSPLQKAAFAYLAISLGMGHYNRKQKEKRENCEKQCKPAGTSLAMWANGSVTKNDLSNPSGNEFLTDCYETTCWNTTDKIEGDVLASEFCSATNVATDSDCVDKCEDHCKSLYPDLTLTDLVQDPSLITSEVLPAAVQSLAESAADAAAAAANAVVDAATDVASNTFGGAFKIIGIIAAVIVGLLLLGLIGYAASKSGKKNA